MPLPQSEREKMLKAYSIGPTMVDLIERAGISSMAELRGRDAGEVLLQIHVETGRKLNVMGLRALENLIALAESDV